MLKLPVIRAFSSCDMGRPACLLFGRHEQAATLNGSGYRMTVTASPIEPSEQFFGAKSQPLEFVSALGRSVTADPIAISDTDLAAIEVRHRFPIHLAMREVDRTRNGAGDLRIRGARVNHNDSGTSSRSGSRNPTSRMSSCRQPTDRRPRHGLARHECGVRGQPVRSCRRPLHQLRSSRI